MHTHKNATQNTVTINDLYTQSERVFNNICVIKVICMETCIYLYKPW